MIQLNGENVISTPKVQFIILQKMRLMKMKDYLNSFIKKDERKILTLIMGGPTKHYEYSTRKY